MKNTTEESGRIASLAVFRELYDSEKDIYGVISCFLTETIITEAKHSFTLHEITCLFNETFNFNIPEAVVKTSLGRLHFLTKSGGTYTANLSGIKSPSIIPKKDEITKNNDLLIKHIVNFIATEKKSELSESEKEEIIHSFCSFLLNKSIKQEYSEYITAFIISNKSDQSFTNQLNCIKEGVVLYTGIMFNENISNVGSWDTELTIFLDTEILFNFVGFNGELYKSLFEDFFSFVKEINQRAAKPLIKLRYFTSVEDEVKYYFKKAESILVGNNIVDPGRPAMNYILNGCKSASDVIEKKTTFFNQLSSNGILADDYSDYYEESNYKYNIIDKSIIESFAKSIGVVDIYDNLNILNFVSIRRKDSRVNNFEHIRYILLSGNLTTLQIAWHNEIKPSGEVPLATDLVFLTNKFWFKLNKGFGANVFPKVFDIITRAQILLSSLLNKSVVSKFEELQSDSQKGLLNEEQAAIILAGLRKESIKPEDINKDNLSFILSSISEANIEKIIQDQEHFKHSAKQREEENIKLKKEITEKQILNEKMLKEKEVMLAKENERKINFNKIEATIENQCQKKCSQRINYFLWIIFGALLAIIISQWHYLKIILTSYVLIFVVIIIIIIFCELRFRKNVLKKIPPKLTEWIPPKGLNYFPKIRIDFENKIIKKCITKKRKNVGLDNDMI